MEKTSDDKKRLKSIVSSLLKTVECPVCLETVKPPFKACIRGHCVCLDCMKKLEKCPLCQESFVLENLVCVKSMLEALPHICCYSDAGCEEVMEPGNNHEMFCGYRPIVCRHPGCSDKMPLVEFLDHRKTHHSKWILWDKVHDNRISWTPSLTFGVTYGPVSIFNNLFWILFISDEAQKQIKIFFQATPIGELEHDYFVRVELKSKEFVYSYTLKCQVSSSCEEKVKTTKEELDEEYCMKIPLNILPKLKNEEGKLYFTLNFFRE